MNIKTIIIAILLAVATITASFAYMATGYSYGYGSGYTMYPGMMSPYQRVDGYQLTYPGPYPYPPNSRFMHEPGYRGEYSAFTGMYRESYTGKPVPQYNPSYKNSMTYTAWGSGYGWY